MDVLISIDMATFLEVKIMVSSLLIISLTDSVQLTTAATLNPASPDSSSPCPMDAQLKVHDLTCGCHDLHNINCSWINDDKCAITAANTPVLKLWDAVYTKPTNEVQVQCNQSSVTGKLQYCYFNIDNQRTDKPVNQFDGLRFQVYVNGEPITGAKHGRFVPYKKAIPLPPTRLKMTRSNESSLQFSWNLPNGWEEEDKDDINYQAQYGENENGPWNEKNIQIKSRSLELNKRRAYKVYCVRVRARIIDQREEKWSDWCTAVCNRTNEGVPASPENLNCKVAKSTSENDISLKNVSITWAALNSSKWNGILIGYSVKICQIGDKCLPVFNVSKDVLQLTKDLRVNQTYKISVRTYNGAHMSSESASMQLTVPYVPVLLKSSNNNNNNMNKVTAMGIVFIMSTIILACISLFIARCFLKKRTTSGIKGPIRIPKTGIVGPLTFKKIENETYTLAVERDPNLGVALVSPDEDVNFVVNSYSETPGRDEGYASLRQSLESYQSLLNESNGKSGSLPRSNLNDHTIDNGSDPYSRDLQHNTNSAITLNYIELYLKKDDDDVSVFEHSLSNTDLSEEQRFNSYSTNPNDSCTISKDETFPSNISSITIDNEQLESDTNNSLNTFVEQVLTSSALETSNAADVCDITTKSATQIAPISESTHRSLDTSMSAYVLMSDASLLSLSVTDVKSNDSKMTLAAGGRPQSNQSLPYVVLASNSSEIHAKVSNEPVIETSIPPEKSLESSNCITALEVIGDYVKHDKIPLDLFTHKRPVVETSKTGPVSSITSGEIEPYVQQAFVQKAQLSDNIPVKVCKKQITTL